MSALEFLRPDGLPPNPGYSHVVVASGKRMIYTAGQVPIDEHGNVVGAGDLAAQQRGQCAMLAGPSRRPVRVTATL
jgi:enamine deaminase RidA (YjgF/YER057c/UK114 family)